MDMHKLDEFPSMPSNAVCSAQGVCANLVQSFCLQEGIRQRTKKSNVPKRLCKVQGGCAMYTKRSRNVYTRGLCNVLMRMCKVQGGCTMYTRGLRNVLMRMCKVQGGCTMYKPLWGAV
jgi:hypothetical protein